MQQLIKKHGQYAVYVAWIIAILATMISLSLSLILHWTPCDLCWYQRICMYPLVAILTVGIVYQDRKVWRYVLGLAPIGWLIAGFHTLLQWGIIPEQVSPCFKSAVSCTTKFFNFFGFVTIPFLSFIAFSGIIVSMLIYARSQKSE
jgi:disulfide bond formation protein DsbB